MDASAPAAGRERRGALLAELTTLRIGGPARRLVHATREEQMIEAAGAADRAGEPLLVIAGGSNLVISDGGFDGTVLRVESRGVTVAEHGDRAYATVAAGEPWDAFVARCVEDGLAGCECLSGIPGSVGAVPIQNVGAYGQQVSETIVSVRVYDRDAGKVVALGREECGFGYRTSRLRHDARHLVLDVTFELGRSGRAQPVRYPELAGALKLADPTARPSLAAVRSAVLTLRSRKGMVVDRGDPDSVSAGSFFINPILSPARFATFERRVTERLGNGTRPPAWPEADGDQIKTSAAWLIEQAGFHRGLRAGRVGLSTKHTLALVNRGGATAVELIALARQIRSGVQDAFGITLAPEPTLVGISL
ncbi:MAG: UDP-N-acetylmuramate dehydrogenase [Solirubrobacteraceae bacterium]